MLGKEWEQMAIILGLTTRDLSEIKAEAADVTMQKLNMLVLWSKRRPRGLATAQLLLSSLTDMMDLSSETEQLLNGNILYLRHTHTVNVYWLSVP